jgi:hypothetical protein
MPVNAFAQPEPMPDYIGNFIKARQAGDQSALSQQTLDMNALRMGEAKKQIGRDEEARNALSVSPESMQYQKAIDAMTKEQLELADKKMEVFRPIMFKAYSTYEDLIAKYKGDKQKAQQEMDANYWPQFAKAAVDAGAPADKITPNYNHAVTSGSLKISEMLTDQLYKVREKAIETKAKAGGGKSGAVTSFLQIEARLQKLYPEMDNDERIKMARDIYAEGKFNKNAAAVRLKASGMSDKRISEFLAGLETGKENSNALAVPGSRPVPTF